MSQLAYLSKFIYLIFFFASLFVATNAHATPKNISFQSKIYKPDGTPLASPNVQFKFSLMNPLSTCVLYAETFSNVDLSASAGSVVLTLGSGTRSYPVAGGMQWFDAFNNATTSYTCQASGTFSPSLVDSRRLVMQFNDGGDWQTLPPMDINSVPYAMFADSAETVPAAGITQSGASVGQVLKWNGSSWAASTDNSGMGGGVTNVSSANLYLSVANSATTPSLTLNVGTAANTVAAGDDARIVGAFQAATALSGDLTGTLPNASIKAGAIDNSKISSVAWGKVSGTPTTLAGYSISDALSAATTYSGDVSGTYNSLALTTTGVGAGTYSKVTVDTKGRVTAGAQFNSADISAALGFTPTSAASQWATNGSKISYIAGNVGIGAASADTTLDVHIGDNPDVTSGIRATGNWPNYQFYSTHSNAGARNWTIVNNWSGGGAQMGLEFRVSNAKDAEPLVTGATMMHLRNDGNLGIGVFNPTSKLEVAGDVTLTGTIKIGGGAPGIGKVLTSDASGNATWAAPAAGAQANATTNGFLGSSDYTNFSNKLSSSLTSGLIFVGNGSNLAEEKVLSGDATINAAGILSLNNTSTARTNLGLGGAAILNVGTGAGTVAAGNDSRFTDSRTPSGTASGDLAGTYPSPSLAAIGAGGTGTKITYDTKGRVTASTSLAAGDIPNIDAAKITTGVLDVARLGSGSADSTRYLRGDGSWSVLAGLPANTKLTKQVRVASTTHVGAVAGYLTIDGVTLVDGDRVLLKNMTPEKYNGVYVVEAGPWQRASDFDDWDKFVNTSIAVSEGTYWAGTTFLPNATAGIGGVLGVTPLTFLTTSGSAYFTAYGMGALRYNTTGTNNVGVGNNVLEHNLTGSSNTAVGAGAMYWNTTGASNTAVGMNALLTTTDSYNTAVGSTALQKATTATANTGLGYATLFQTTTGGYNTALGHTALTNVTTGTNNIGIGYDSGSAITTGSNNVVIGSNTGTSIAALSNNILIADGSGNERIRVLADGKVGIGTSAPGYAFSVSGDVNVTGSFRVNGSSIGTSSLLNVPVAGDAGAGEIVKGDDSRLINSRAPAGSASGDLSGTYPGPTLAVIGAGGTGTKITYDTKGRVTASANLNSADITTALGYTPATNHWSQNASNDLSYSAGNVGIGTSTPGVSLDVTGGIRPGSSTAVSACGAGAVNGEGTMRYNYTTHNMEFCNGTTWIAFNSGASNAPSAFSFTNVVDSPVTKTHTSNAVVVSGFVGPVTATCNAGCAEISRNGGAFSAGPVAGFYPGDTIAIKRVSSSSYNTAVTASVNLGGTSSSPWSITTMAAFPYTPPGGSTYEAGGGGAVAGSFYALIDELNVRVIFVKGSSINAGGTLYGTAIGSYNRYLLASNGGTVTGTLSAITIGAGGAGGYNGANGGSGGGSGFIVTDSNLAAGGGTAISFTLGVGGTRNVAQNGTSANNCGVTDAASGTSSTFTFGVAAPTTANGGNGGYENWSCATGTPGGALGGPGAVVNTGGAGTAGSGSTGLYGAGGAGGAASAGGATAAGGGGGGGFVYGGATGENGNDGYSNAYGVTVRGGKTGTGFGSGGGGGAGTGAWDPTGSYGGAGGPGAVVLQW